MPLPPLPPRLHFLPSHGTTFPPPKSDVSGSPTASRDRKTIFTLFFSSGEHLKRKETITLGGGRRAEGEVGWREEGWRSLKAETRDIWKTLGTNQEKHPLVQSASGSEASQRETDLLLSVCQLLQPTALDNRGRHKQLWLSSGWLCGSHCFLPVSTFSGSKHFVNPADREQTHLER